MIKIYVQEVRTPVPGGESGEVEVCDRLWGGCGVCGSADVFAASPREPVYVGRSRGGGGVLSWSGQEDLFHGQYLRTQYETEAVYGGIREDACIEAGCVHHE